MLIHRFPILLVLTMFLAAGPLRAAEQKTTETKPPASSSASGQPAQAKIDLNHATVTELQTLPGVGPATAQSIVKARPFKSVNELTNISGLTPAKVATLKPHVKVSSATAASKSSPTETASSNKKPTPSERINLNDASVQELETLPGVGATIAQAIVKARPFKSVDELTNVTGIGSSKLAALKPHVMVRAPSNVGHAAPAEHATGRSTTAATSPRSTTATAPSSAKAGELVNLNTATKEDLESLPGIGPVRAQAIIDARPFEKPEDVMKVPGIKEGIFGEIKDKVTVK